MNNLKIAFLTEFFYPHVGGCETRYLEIGRRLVNKGHEIHIFTIQYDLSLPKEETIEGIFVHRYAHSKKYVSEDGFRSIKGILKFSVYSFIKLRNTKFDIYYANQWPMLHSFFSKPVASPLIQEWCEVWEKPLKVKLMQKMLKSIGDFNVAVSEFTQQRIVKSLGIDVKKTVIISNGVSTTRFSNPTEKVYGRIIYAGRIAQHKNVELLIEAFREVKNKKPEAELHIVGSGICLESVKNLASTIKDCYVHGFVSDEKMVELLKSAWLFVLPSEREGSGIAVMEAMAAGVPFITVDYPNNAAKELCQHNCGLVVEPNQNAIATAVIELIEKNQLWKELSKNALNTAKIYDWDTVTNQMEAVFKMVVKKFVK
ncbi:MAG: glycosyltransferase family 4 protein [Crenarchaeota archaeon]|nr:glycosyltransferase family 4 protein [Thermoproteota archaeon]